MWCIILQLFKISEEVVVDATDKGNIARLINHSVSHYVDLGGFQSYLVLPRTVAFVYMLWWCGRFCCHFMLQIEPKLVYHQICMKWYQPSSLFPWCGIVKVADAETIETRLEEADVNLILACYCWCFVDYYNSLILLCYFLLFSSFYYSVCPTAMRG